MQVSQLDLRIFQDGYLLDQGMLPVKNPATARCSSSEVLSWLATPLSSTDLGGLALRYSAVPRSTTLKTRLLDLILTL